MFKLPHSHYFDLLSLRVVSLPNTKKSSLVCFKHPTPVSTIGFKEHISEALYNCKSYVEAEVGKCIGVVNSVYSISL